MAAITPDSDTFRPEIFRQFIIEAVQNRGRLNEAQVRNFFLTSLRDAYPDPSTRPIWIQQYVLGEEHKVRTVSAGPDSNQPAKKKRGAVDVVIGLTAVEYEKNLKPRRTYEHAINQIKEYCAGLINPGADPSKVRGVVSDTVLWKVFQVQLPNPRPGRPLGRDDITLSEIDELDLADESRSLEVRVEQLRRFLEKHFNRPGMRELTAENVADYFGPVSYLGSALTAQCEQFIEEVFSSDTETANTIKKHWVERAKQLAGDPSKVQYEPQVYAHEFYVSLLARLLAANVIAEKALVSSTDELEDILTGRYFKKFGVLHFVEPDVFSWPAATGHVARLLPVAVAIQTGLTDFDFSTTPGTDLFSELVPLLAGRERRILLGQGSTPSWLAQKLAKSLVKRMPLAKGEAELPRVIDPTCGSGSLLVATLRELLENVDAEHDLETAARLVREAITGFDIDPLAVVLARANWTMTVKEVLKELRRQGQYANPPIYLADALAPTEEDQPPHITFNDASIEIPSVLLEPRRHALLYALMSSSAEPSRQGETDEGLVDIAVSEAGLDVDQGTTEYREIVGFASRVREELGKFEPLERRIVATTTRNSVQPHFAKGRFQGAISNPPWLALSKIKQNPMTDRFKNLANTYSIKARGSSYLHQEAATVFVAVTLSTYLQDKGTSVFLLPDSVRNGKNHIAFRELVMGAAEAPTWHVVLDEIWDTPTNTFLSKAVAFIATKDLPQGPVAPGSEIDGLSVAPHRDDQECSWHVAVVDDAYYWLDQKPFAIVRQADRYSFKQGADLMPRTTVFFRIEDPDDGDTEVEINSIESTHEDHYLLSGANTVKDFKVDSEWVPVKYIHPALLSHHLAPFVLSAPAKAVLPVATNNDGWRMVTEGYETSFRDFMHKVVNACGLTDTNARVNYLNTRNKIAQQTQPLGSWVVVQSAGGGIPAGAFWHVETPEDRRLIDQTLYWLTVESEDEGLYLVGMINSQALRTAIAPYLPRGNFSNRHIHTWPTKFIPRYDPDSDLHATVVSTTRELLGQVKASSEIQSQLTPSLIDRRVDLRTAISQLPGAPNYERACEAVLSEDTPDPESRGGSDEDE